MFDCQADAMPLSPPTLDQIQRWLQAVMTHPAGVAAVIESDEARRQIDAGGDTLEEVILPSRRQTSLQRLAVYGNAYYLRLLDCLREFFPCLVEALSRETFDEFAVGYLQRYPSESYTLHRLADRYVQFLDETRPERNAEWAGFVVDLARLELAIEHVFDAPGPEPDPWPEQAASDGSPAIPLAALSANLLAAETRLVPTPGLTLLAFTWPVSTYYTGWKRGEQPAWPQPGPQFVALLRRDYVVRRHELSPSMYELLSRLVSGMPVGAAIGQLSAAPPEANLSPERLREWFFQWARDGFFAGAAAPDRPPADSARLPAPWPAITMKEP